MTEVYLLNIPDVSDERFGELLSYVSEERKGKILRLRDRGKQCQSLFGGLLVRAVLCSRLDVHNGQLEFGKTAEGKPYLSGGELNFSLSHTDSLAAVAVCGHTVGVDAERVKEIDPGLCQRFFSLEEQDYVLPGADGWQTRFFEVWTRKEAVVKRSGCGMTCGIASIYTGKDEKALHTATVEDCVVSVCCDDGCVRIIPSRDTEKLMSEFLLKNGKR